MRPEWQRLLRRLTRQAVGRTRGKKNRGPTGSPRRAYHGSTPCREFKDSYSTSTRGPEGESRSSALPNCRKKLAGLGLGCNPRESTAIADCRLQIGNLRFAVCPAARLPDRPKPVSLTVDRHPPRRDESVVL